jgi:hypothetical protein
MNQFERMMLAIERDKMLTIIYDNIDKHEALGCKESLFEIEDPALAEAVEETLVQNKNIDKVNSYWNDKYATCFLVVTWS